MRDNEKLKEALLKYHTKKGDFDKIGDFLLKEESQQKSDRMLELLEPISGFADMLTKNTHGVFMGELQEELRNTSSEASQKLADQVSKAEKELSKSLKALFKEETNSLRRDAIDRYAKAQQKFEKTSQALITQLISDRADEMFTTLGQDAKLTADEIAEIELNAALSVESQMPTLIADYLNEADIAVDKIKGFKEAVQRLIPDVDFSKAVIDWRQIKNAPQMQGGGAGARALYWLNDITNASTATDGQVLTANGDGTFTFEAASGLPDQSGNSGKYLTTDGSSASWATLAGGGDMAAATYDPATIAEQLVGLTASQTLTNKTLTQPTITLKQGTAPTPTAEGDIQWDTDDNKIKVGDGLSTLTFSDDSYNAAAYQPLDSDLTTIAAANNGSVLAATTASFLTADETKLDGIEAGADVTDTANVTAAGALMDSEVSSLSGIKTLTVPDSTTISTFGATLVDDTTAAAARTTLGVDAAGTDNSATLYVTVGDSNTDYPVASYTDVGDAINTAYAALPSTGGTIFVQNGTYTFTTPIVFGTDGKIASLIGASAGSTYLQYTPTSGNAITLNFGLDQGLHRPSQIANFTLMGTTSFVYDTTANTRTSVGVYVGGANAAPLVHMHDMMINGFGTQLETGAGCYMFSATDCHFSGGNGVNGIATGLQGSLVHINTASNSGERMVFKNCTFTDPCNSEADNAFYVESSGAASLIIDSCSIDNAQLRIIGSTNAIVTNCHIENPYWTAYGAYTPIYIDDYIYGSFTFTNNEVVDAATDGTKNFPSIIKHGINLVAIGTHVSNYGNQTIQVLFDNSINASQSSEYVQGTVVETGNVTEIINGFPYTAQAGMGIVTSFRGGAVSAQNVNSDGTYDFIAGDTNIALTLNSDGSVKVSDAYTLPSADGTANYYLKTDGAGTVSWAAGSGSGLANVVDDTTPQLGGNLDVNGNAIVSVTNGDIEITPNGTGIVAIGTTGLNPTLGNTVTNMDDTNLLVIGGHGTSVAVGVNTYHSRGTTASPTATQSGDRMYFMGGRGYGATTYGIGSKSAVSLNAAENWTDSAQGTNITFENTPTGSTTRATDVTIDSGGIDLSSSRSLSVNGTNILADSAGTMTLSNIDALDATTEATIEAAIDTLSNLTTVGTVTSGNVDAVVSSASTTTAGKIEIATSAETTTGTDATRAVSPDGLAGSEFGKRTVGILVSGSASGDSALATGDGLAAFPIDSTLNGMNLVAVKAYVTTVSSSGAPLFQVRRSRRSSATARTTVDMLTTGVSIDASEFESADATTAVSINGTNDDVQTGDILLIDCDTAGTGTKGAQLLLTFQLP